MKNDEMLFSIKNRQFLADEIYASGESSIAFLFANEFTDFFCLSLMWVIHHTMVVCWCRLELPIFCLKLAQTFLIYAAVRQKLWARIHSILCRFHIFCAFLSKFTQDWFHLPTQNGAVTSVISKERFRSGRPRIRTPTFDAIDLSSSKLFKETHKWKQTHFLIMVEPICAKLVRSKKVWSNIIVPAIYAHTASMHIFLTNETFEPIIPILAVWA